MLWNLLKQTKKLNKVSVPPHHFFVYFDDVFSKILDPVYLSNILYTGDVGIKQRRGDLQRGVLKKKFRGIFLITSPHKSKLVAFEWKCSKN